MTKPKQDCTGTRSVAVAVADVFSKNGQSIPNKFDKILKIFDRLDDVPRGHVFYLRNSTNCSSVI